MIRLSQQKYIQDLITQYNVVEDPKVTAPMSTSYQLVQRTDQLSEKEMELMRERPFLSLLSALLWVARCTRPDILLSLTLLARASSNPDPTHWRALIKVLKYLQNTIAWCIQLRPINLTDPQLVQFSDASHANDYPTGRSITGNFTLLDGNLLDWACKHQPYVTLHSGEAETVAASTGCTHIQYWQQLPLLGKNGPAIEFVLTTLKAVAKDIFGFELKPIVVIGDRSLSLYNAIQKVFPSARWVNCYVHLSRKGKTEYLKKYHVKAENKDEVCAAIDLLHRCSTLEMFRCFMSIVVLVLERLGEREYAKWLREEYGKEPFEYWYVTATGVVGLRSDNQAEEAYNKTVKAYKWLGGLRQPADSVLNDAFPRLFQADVRERGAHVRMGLMPTPVDAAESVHRAASLISVKKLYRVDNDVLYMNTSSFGEYAMSPQRVKNFENARAGRLDPVKASKLSIAELTWLYASVHRVAPVEKCNEVVFARRPMVCTCHRCWHMETCSHCASYEHIVLKERDLVKETEPLPRNSRAGAPKKSKGALSKQ
ncbi:retrovirus-related Pol polyprotein [Pseudoscourfieldia marina]